MCRGIFSARKAPTDWTREWEEAKGRLSDDGIAELARISEVTLADERDRGRQLDGKTTTLAGFSGLILSIDAALARSVFSVDLGSVGTVVAKLGFVVSAVALLCAVALAIAGVLMPQRYRALGLETIDGFASPQLQTSSRQTVQRSLIPALNVSLIQERSVNDCKARLCKGVARFQLVGFAALAAAAITLAEHSIS